MNIYHKQEVINGKSTIVIYAYYPDEYEFGLDFNAIKEKVKSVSDKIREYALKNIGSVSNDTALLVLNGVVIGTLLLSGVAVHKNNYVNASTQIEQSYDVNSEVNDGDKTESKVLEEQVSNVNNSDTKEQYEQEVPKVEEAVQNVEQSQTSVNNDSQAPIEPVKTQTNKTTTTASKKPNTTKPSVNKTPVQSPPAQNTPAPSTPAPSIPNQTAPAPSTNNTPSTPAVSNKKMINLKRNNGAVVQIELEEYIIGVVSAEMPASFDVEALKAQAVAARTYALKSEEKGKVLTGTTADQVYKNNDELKAKWGSSYSTYYNKVKGAVEATSGECITYNGKYIDALYFSTSNGRTEDPGVVFGTPYDYMKSVESPWDTGASTFNSSKTFSIADICQKLGVNISSVDDIVIQSKTIGDRVQSVLIGGKEFTGVKVRTLLGLRSADFEVSQSGNNITFKTKGYGHGCGMSQYGANGMAKAGKNYKQILQHYYTGVQIQKMV